MCILHCTYLAFIKYGTPGRGAAHTLRMYVYATLSLLALVVLLFCASWVMMTMDQFYDYKIPKRGAAVPAMIAGVVLLVMVLEVAALHDTLHRLWLEYRINRLHNTGARNDTNGDAPEYSDQATADAELEAASRMLAEQREDARRFGERSDMSGDD